MWCRRGGARRRGWSVRAGFPDLVGAEESLEVSPRVFVGISEKRGTKTHAHHLSGDQHDPSIGNEKLHLGESVERDTSVIYAGKFGGDLGAGALVVTVAGLQPARRAGCVDASKAGMHMTGAWDVHRTPAA